MPPVSPSNWSCPICKKPVDEGSSHFPFCGDRCKLIDLGRWLDGSYVERLTNDLPPREFDVQDSD